MVSRKEAVVVAGILAAFSFGVAGLAEVSAQSDQSANSVKAATSCVYDLTQGSSEPGTATVNIRPRSLRIRVRGAEPNTMFTVWTDHRSRATGQRADDFPVDFYPPGHPNAGEPIPVDPTTSLHGDAHPRGVAPAVASTAGITSGMGLDGNAFRTNGRGNANFRVRLDYNLLEPGASPIIAADLATQGANIVGGSWLRMYTQPVAVPSVQAVDGNGLPIVVRSTAQGFTVQRHDDPTSHGHFPGTGTVDHVNAWKGDFPAECMNP